MFVSPFKSTRDAPMNGLAVAVVVVVALMDTVEVGVVVVAIIVVMFVVMVFVAATVVKPSRAAIDMHEYNIENIFLSILCVIVIT
jgi:ABC-type multidrug transport system fused ATPase/permease subunit